MKRSMIMLALATLSLWLWAADDAAVVPSQGVAAAPLTDNLIAAVDAITIPRMLSYQGRLTDSLGNPVPDGNYQMTFRLYQQETGGTPFWTEAQTVMVRGGLFSALLGAVTPINSIPDAGTVWLGLQVGITPELAPRLRIVSSAYSYLSEHSANADSAVGAERLGGYNIAGLDARYVNEGQENSITSAMIIDGTIVRQDVASSFKAPYSDTADYARLAPTTDSARVAANSHKLQGKDTTALSAKFVDEGQTNAISTGMIQDNAITSAKIQDGTIAAADLNQMGAGTGQVLKWTGSAWAPQNDSVGQADNAWVRGTQDSVLFTIRQLGIARGGANNMLYGSYRYTHINLGVACTTGTSGQNYLYCTVGGGGANTASGHLATVGGGYDNTASGSYATVAGGEGNAASGQDATVGGGYDNTASGYYATVGGGGANTASGNFATVLGGYYNIARGGCSFTAGEYARANHRGSFIWSDSAVSASESVYTTGNDQFRVRARGGTWFYSNAGKTTGVYLAPGSNSWAGISDIMDETDFAPVDKKAVSYTHLTLPTNREV